MYGARRRTCLACCLLLCLSVAGCNRPPEQSPAIGSVDPSESGETESQSPRPESESTAQTGGDDAPEGPGGAPGAPLNEGGGGPAVAAPITIPAFTQIGADFNEQRGNIEQAIIEACGDGTLCLNIRAEVDDVEGEERPCVISGVPPPETVERGTTITFEIEAPCDASPPDDDEPPDGEQSPDDEEPPDGEQSPDGEEPPTEGEQAPVSESEDSAGR